jgi:uncharacterized protein (DUF58 family)
METSGDTLRNILLSQKVLLDIFIGHRVQTSLSGDWESVARGTGYEFWGLREMTPMDSGKYIDWKATARFGTPVVRQYLSESYTNLMILYDVSRSMAFGNKRLLQAIIAASLAYTAAMTNNACGVVFFSDRVLSHVPPKMGWNHFHHLIDAISKVQSDPCRLTDVHPALLRLAQDIPESLTFVLSDFLFPVTLRQHFRKDGKTRHEVIAIQVLEDFEVSLPAGCGGMIALKDLETEKAVVVDLSEWSKYNRNMRRHQEKLKNQFADAGISWTAITPSDRFSEKINSLMKGETLHRS